MLLSAGILFYRKQNNRTEVFLVHPGGPYNAKKDTGAWSIPKGEPDENEKLVDAAIREVQEEIQVEIKDRSKLKYLGEVKQKGGKVVHAWSYQLNNGIKIKSDSNKIKIEWPPKSGKFVEVPEVDRGEWFDLETAKEKINPAQAAFIERLIRFSKTNFQ